MGKIAQGKQAWESFPGEVSVDRVLTPDIHVTFPKRLRLSSIPDIEASRSSTRIKHPGRTLTNRKQYALLGAQDNMSTFSSTMQYIATATDFVFLYSSKSSCLPSYQLWHLKHAAHEVAL